MQNLNNRDSLAKELVAITEEVLLTRYEQFKAKYITQELLDKFRECARAGCGECRFKWPGNTIIEHWCRWASENDFYIFTEKLLDEDTITICWKP